MMTLPLATPAVIRGVADSIPSFTSQVTLYTKYSQALNYVPGTRNRLSFVVAGVSDGADPEVVAQRIERFTPIVGKDRVIAGSDCGGQMIAEFLADPDPVAMDTSCLDDMPAQRFRVDSMGSLSPAASEDKP
mgnify:CR=1 FL=1